MTNISVIKVESKEETLPPTCVRKWHEHFLVWIAWVFSQNKMVCDFEAIRK